MTLDRPRIGMDETVGAFIPCKSAREAKALTRFFNMTDAQQVEALAEMIFVPLRSPAGETDRIARTLLNVINVGRK
jgi:hypothetical protein